MPRRIAIAAVLLVALPAPARARAALRLPALIGDNMVCQQGAQIAVWGRAEPGQQVKVTLASQAATAAADKAGRWQVKLPAMKAGGPFEMVIAAGADVVRARNVMVGEVWVCSGQSNMQMGLFDRDAVRSAEYPDIRLFRVGRQSGLTPAADVAGQWTPCRGRAAVGFSAVAYYFGRALHKARKVPVGLINSGVGGTVAEMWIPEKALADDDRLKRHLRRRKTEYERSESLRAAYAPKLAAWRQAADAAVAAGRKPPPAPYMPRLIDKYTTGLYNGMIAPLTPYRVRGVAWYQGEANAYNHATAAEYRRLLGTLIRSWRAAWGYPVAFLIVQLPNYKARQLEPTDTAWARLRESQLAALRLPHTAIAVTIDIGDARNIHPPNKLDVGRRLALAARGAVYGEPIVYCGPIYKSMTVEGAKVRLTFEHVGAGLVAKGRRLIGFSAAGDDRRFHRADAVIDGDTVVVSSRHVPKPVAVRYGWADNPECNLYNSAGLPASPFRTDAWPPAAQPLDLPDLGPR